MTLLILLVVVLALLLIAWLVPMDAKVKQTINIVAIVLLIALLIWILVLLVPGFATARIGSNG